MTARVEYHVYAMHIPKVGYCVTFVIGEIWQQGVNEYWSYFNYKGLTHRNEVPKVENLAYAYI